MTPGLRLRGAYVGARGNHLLRTIEENQFPIPVVRPDGSLFFPPDPFPDPVFGPTNYINPAFGSIEKTLTDAQSFYNAFSVSANHNMWKGISLGANYTFSKSIDDDSAAQGAMQHYALDRKLNRGLSSFDLRHRLSVNFFYSLPFGPGQTWLSTGRLSDVLGGWRMGGILSMHSGVPADLRYGIPVPGYLLVSFRPSLAAGRSNNPVGGISSGCGVVKQGEKLGRADRYYDPCAFLPPAPGTLGDLGRNVVIGPALTSLDFSLQKTFPLDSRRSLQFRAEFFNATNHPNFRAPELASSTVFQDTSGSINPSAGKLLSTATTSRQIQFALRFSF